MNLTTGDEFRDAATPDQALLLKLAALRDAGSGAVLSPATENGGAPSRRTATADLMHFILQQQRDEQIRLFNERLDDLDRRSDEALRHADERLADVLRTANKSKDGRAVFQDEDGSIYDEHGNEVAAGEVDWTQWKAERPNWSAYQDALQDRDAAQAFKAKVDDLQDRMAEGLDDKDLAGFDDDLTALESESQGFAGASWTSAVAERSTSAAKLYDVDAVPRVTAVDSFDRAVRPVEEEQPISPANDRSVLTFTPQ